MIVQRSLSDCGFSGKAIPPNLFMAWRDEDSLSNGNAVLRRATYRRKTYSGLVIFSNIA